MNFIRITAFFKPLDTIQRKRCAKLVSFHSYALALFYFSICTFSDYNLNQYYFPIIQIIFALLIRVYVIHSFSRSNNSKHCDFELIIHFIPIQNQYYTNHFLLHNNVYISRNKIKVNNKCEKNIK